MPAVEGVRRVRVTDAGAGRLLGVAEGWKAELIVLLVLDTRLPRKLRKLVVNGTPAGLKLFVMERVTPSPAPTEEAV